jgi:hypothetical protein
MAARVGDNAFVVVAVAENLMSVNVLIIDCQDCPVVMDGQRHTVTIIAKPRRVLAAVPLVT